MGDAEIEKEEYSISEPTFHRIIWVKNPRGFGNLEGFVPKIFNLGRARCPN